MQSGAGQHAAAQCPQARVGSDCAQRRVRHIELGNHPLQTVGHQADGLDDEDHHQAPVDFAGRRIHRLQRALSRQQLGTGPGQFEGRHLHGIEQIRLQRAAIGAALRQGRSGLVERATQLRQQAHHIFRYRYSGNVKHKLNSTHHESAVGRRRYSATRCRASTSRARATTGASIILPR
ncbi:hypothetical protein FQZ97_982210 [compost metagenome]